MKHERLLCAGVVLVCAVAFGMQNTDVTARPAPKLPLGGPLPAKMLGKWQTTELWMNGTKISPNGWSRMELRKDNTKLGSQGAWNQTGITFGGGYKCGVSGNTFTCEPDYQVKFRFEGDALVFYNENFVEKFARYDGDMEAPPASTSSASAPMTPERRALEQCAREKGGQIRVISFGPVITRGGSKVAKMTIDVTIQVGGQSGVTRSDGEATYEKADDGKWYLTSAHAGFNFAVSCATPVK